MSDKSAGATEYRLQLEAEDRKIDAARPDISARGVRKMYHVGLTPDAPFDFINVPTVIMRGTLRGKCVEVPKKTASMQQLSNGTLVHHEGAKDGRFEALYDIEVAGFVKYCDTHIFRKISDYEVPVVGANGKATGQTKKHWRAEIEPADPALAGGARSLHDETEIVGESISKYVWISEVTNFDGQKRPIANGPQETIAAKREREAKVAAGSKGQSNK